MRQAVITLGAVSGAEVPVTLFGHNLEHTRSCIANGLSAQMLRNRKFAGKPQENLGVAMEWNPVGGRAYWYMDDRDSYTRHVQPDKMVRRNEMQSQKIQNYQPGMPAGISQRRLVVAAGADYELRLVLKANTRVQVHVALCGQDGREYAFLDFPCSGQDWNVYEGTLHCTATDRRAALTVTFSQQGELGIGAVSLLPAGHFRGMRRDVVEALRELGVSMLRWPGGNFAGEYRWQDGLLPVDMRAPLLAYMEGETQPHTLGFDFHELNTDDFLALCEELGALPFLTVNLAWDTPEECAQWVEYLNGGASTPWGARRAERGHREPYGVKYWSLGNEMGFGHMEGPNAPELYREKALACAEKLLACDGSLKLFSSGPYPSEEWVEKCAVPLGEHAPYLSLHSYDPFDVVSFMDFTTRRKAAASYLRIVEAPLRNRDLVRNLRAMLDGCPGGEKVRISFDEWNVWYAWFRVSGAAEGIYTARMLGMFLREWQRSQMPVCCYFEPVNEGAMVVNPTGTALTANGQMFAAFSPHAGGREVLCRCQGLEDLDAFATVKEGRGVLTVTNAHEQEPLEVELRLGDWSIQGGVQYTAPDYLPGSRFEKSGITWEARPGGAVVTIPAYSVAVLEID